MRTNRIKQILNSEKSKLSVNTDTYLKINLDSKEILLPTDEINKVVNVGERFNVERQNSKFYRILGTINPTVSNALFNLNDSLYSDKQTWSYFNSLDFLDTSYPKDGDVSDLTDVIYSDSIKKFLKEVDGWFGYTDPDKTKPALCNFFDMEPKRERFSFIPDINPFSGPKEPVKNWELTISYPKDTDKTHNMVNGGLLIVETSQAIVSTRIMTAFGMGCLHNLNVGDIVRITGTVGYDGDHVVIRLGKDNGDLKGYYFVIDKPQNGSVSGNSRIKRMFGGVESEYYFRKFRKIKTRSSLVIEPDDYETYKLAFSENIYNDAITQFVFNEDIDVSDLTDNLGRPLSEIYLTIIKTDSDGLFTNISSGIESPFIAELNTSNTNGYLRDIPVINKIHNGVSGSPFISHTPLESNLNINLYNYYGDLVEYNKNEVKETILSEVSHRFNTLNRETSAPISYVNALGTPLTTTTIDLGPRQEGYFYKAHHLIKIREFSNYIEQGDKFTEGIPEYAVDLGDGRFLWRDLLDIGFNEINEKTLDYPFLNGSHYMYDNYCFHVRRQDPFNNWDLFFSSFPSDPIGSRITDQFNVNREDDIC